MTKLLSRCKICDFEDQSALTIIFLKFLNCKFILHPLKLDLIPNIVRPYFVLKITKKIQKFFSCDFFDELIGYTYCGHYIPCSLRSAIVGRPADLECTFLEGKSYVSWAMQNTLLQSLLIIYATCQFFQNNRRDSKLLTLVDHTFSHIRSEMHFRGIYH